MSIKRLIILVACAGALAAPATAGASTITRDATGALVYAAAPGEANIVDVSPGFKNGWDTDPTLVVFSDASSVTQDIQADGCVSVLPTSTQCSLGPGGVRVSLGDRDDRFTTGSDLAAEMALVVDGGAGADRLTAGADGGPAVTFSGGDGDDQLTGGPAADMLDGGAGNDEVDGAGGPDQVLGGAGDDILHGDHFEQPAADVIDGGPGTDTLTDDYKSRFSDLAPDVSITLNGGADDGRPGEGDDVRNVEDVVVSGGGQLVGTDGPELLKALTTSTGAVTLDGRGGNDQLAGGGGADTITGGAGDDTINAGYGNDTIVGGPGRDTVHADQTSGGCGPVWCDEPYGNDTIDVRDGEVDSVDCGVGTDQVTADPQDVIAPDCEVVDRGSSPTTTGNDPKTTTTNGPTGPRPTGPPGPTTHAPGKTTNTTTARLSLVGRPTLRSVIAHGLTVRVAGVHGRVTVTAHLGKRIAGRGTGSRTVRITLNRRAAHQLRAARRATLVLTGPGIRRRVTLHR